MSGPVVLSGNTLAAGIISRFESTYRQSYQGELEDLGNCMELAVPAATRTVTYAMHDTPAYPSRQELGDPVKREGFQSKTMSVTNYEYSAMIPWYRRDRTDNQVGDLMGHAAQAAMHYLSLDSRALIEIATGTLDLLPAAPTAPDGVGLYSTTDGDSANRFGVSNGNIEGGAGTSAANITTDWHSVLARFDAFQNPKGQPFFPVSRRGTTYTIYAPSDLRAAFIGSFNAELIQGSSAAPSNTIIASGENIRLVFTPRLSGTNDWLVFRNDVTVKPVFGQVRQPLRTFIATDENSDEARNSGIESVKFTAEMGWGINVPFGTIKVTN